MQLQTRTFTNVARALSTSVVLSAALLASSAAQAGLMFQFTFSNDPGASPNTLAQQQAIITGGQLFSALFGTYFTNSATLQFDVVSQTSGVASASTDAALSSTSPSVEVVMSKLQTGVDTNGAAADGEVNINWSNLFVLDPNAPVDFAAGEIDLFSVLDHEFTHALGFFGLTGLSNGGLQNKFDGYLTTLSGTRVIDPAGMINSAAYADAELNNALFTGANAVAANGGAGVSIQGRGGDPAAFSGALSHLGTNAFSAPVGGSPNDNALMLCCGGLNVTGEPRDYNAVEIGILTDLGYTRVAVNDVPEPGSLALLGLGLAGFATIRKRKQA